jgi:putative spermidine/putrescine transport system permease protein
MRKKNIGLSILAVLVFAFLVIPLLIVVVTAFGESPSIRFPIKGFSLQWFDKALSTESFMTGLATSLKVSLTATAIAILIGVPAAYALARGSVRNRAFLKSFFLSPTFVPGIVIGFAMFQFITIKLRMEIMTSLFVGHFLISLPYIIRVVGSSLEQFDFSVEEAAWTLGCTRTKTFVKIVLPNISSGIFASFMLAFINSFNNIPVSMFLSGPGVQTLPIALMNHIEYNYDPTVSAMSVLLMLCTILLMWVIEKTLGLATIA